MRELSAARDSSPRDGSAALYHALGIAPRVAPMADRDQAQQFSFWWGPLRRLPLRPCLGRGTRRGQHRARRAHGSPPGSRADTSLARARRRRRPASRLDGLRPRGSPPFFRVPRPQPPSSGDPSRRRRRLGSSGASGSRARRGDASGGTRPRVLRPRDRASTRTPFGLAPPAAPFPSPPSSIAAAASSRGSPRRFAGGLEAGKRRPSPTPPGRPARARRPANGSRGSFPGDPFPRARRAGAGSQAGATGAAAP